MQLKNALELFLALLYSNEKEEIKGVTRLMKLMFLLVKEGGFSQFEKELDFESYYYGPWSSEIYLDYPETLKELGVLKIEEKESFEIDIDERYSSDLIELEEKKIKIFSLTEEGKKVAKTFYDRLSKNEKINIEEIKKRWNKANPLELIKYVYYHFINYIDKSKIKEKVFSNLKVSPSLIKLIGIIPPISLQEEKDIIEKSIQESLFK